MLTLAMLEIVCDAQINAPGNQGNTHGTPMETMASSVQEINVVKMEAPALQLTTTIKCVEEARPRTAPMEEGHLQAHLQVLLQAPHLQHHHPHQEPACASSMSIEH